MDMQKKKKKIVENIRQKLKEMTVDWDCKIGRQFTITALAKVSKFTSKSTFQLFSSLTTEDQLSKQKQLK